MTKRTFIEHHSMLTAYRNAIDRIHAMKLAAKRLPEKRIYLDVEGQSIEMTDHIAKMLISHEIKTNTAKAKMIAKKIGIAFEEP